MFQATFTRRFSAAHRVAGDPGACQRIHGHNYEAVIEVASDKIGSEGFVLPADVVKEIVDGQLDHRLILAADDPLVIGVRKETAHPANGPLLRSIESDGWVVRVPDTPTTEVLAQYIATLVGNAAREHQAQQDPDQIRVTVKLTETPTISATSTVYNTREPVARWLDSEQQS